MIYSWIAVCLMILYWRRKCIINTSQSRFIFFNIKITLYNVYYYIVYTIQDQTIQLTHVRLDVRKNNQIIYIHQHSTEKYSRLLVFSMSAQIRIRYAFDVWKLHGWSTTTLLIVKVKKSIVQRLTLIRRRIFVLRVFYMKAFWSNATAANQLQQTITRKKKKRDSKNR